MTENNSQSRILRRSALRGSISATTRNSATTSSTSSIIIPVQQSTESDFTTEERQQIIDDIRRIISRPRTSPKRKLFEDDEEEEEVKSEETQGTKSGESSSDESLSRSPKIRRTDSPLRNWMDQQQQISRQQWLAKYNFDIEEGEPLEGTYSWELVSGVQDK